MAEDNDRLRTRLLIGWQKISSENRRHAEQFEAIGGDLRREVRCWSGAVVAESVEDAADQCDANERLYFCDCQSLKSG